MIQHSHPRAAVDCGLSSSILRKAASASRHAAHVEQSPRPHLVAGVVERVELDRPLRQAQGLLEVAARPAGSAPPSARSPRRPAPARAPGGRNAVLPSRPQVHRAEDEGHRQVRLGQVRLEGERAVCRVARLGESLQVVARSPRAGHPSPCARRAPARGRPRRRRSPRRWRARAGSTRLPSPDRACCRAGTGGGPAAGAGAPRRRRCGPSWRRARPRQPPRRSP